MAFISLRRREFNGRFISEKSMKKNWTVLQFANYFGVSEEEFLKELENTFPESYQKIRRQLDRNQNKSKKGGGSRSRKIKVMPEKVEPVQEESIQTVVEGEQEMEMTNKDILSELKEKEELVQKELCQREAKKSSLIVIRQNKRAELKKVQDKIKKWILELAQLETEVDEKVKEIQEDSGNIETLNVEIAYYGELLESIRKEIVELEKVSIFVYKDGEIEADGIEQVVIPESWEDIYRDLSRDESVEDLTIKQIKMLSKTMAFLVSLDRKYEVTFEIDEIQKVFDIIVAEKGGNN